MGTKLWDRFTNLPIIRQLIEVLVAIKIPGLKGMSLFDLFERYFIGILKGAITTRASGIAYSFFMAIFPFLLFILTLISFIPIAGFSETFTDFIEQILPPKTYDAVENVIIDIVNNRYGGLLSFGFLASIFLMANGVSAIFASFEYSYYKVESRNVFKAYFLSVGISLVMSFFLIITVVALVFIKFLLDYFQNSGWLDDMTFWLELGRQVIFVICVLMIVSILYYYGTREGKKQAFFSPGSIMTTILSIGTFSLFGIYVEKFARYNELDGSIGTLLIIMIFIWLNSIILLLGYELNVSLLGLKKLSKSQNLEEIGSILKN
jgi:membrane protein